MITSINVEKANDKIQYTFMIKKKKLSKIGTEGKRPQLDKEHL